MRMLQRNQRTLFYANPTEVLAPIMDEYGNETGEVSEVYTEPVEIKLNISAAVGQEAIEVFGSETSYTRVIAADASCPIVERARVWYQRSTTQPHNYVVRKVADSLNSKLLALSEV